MMCAQFIPAPITITLPIVKVETTTCGVFYHAERNSLPVDGDLQTITVADYTSAMECEIKVVAPIIVNHTSTSFDHLNGKNKTLNSIFYSSGWMAKNEIF